MNLKIEQITNIIGGVRRYVADLTVCKNNKPTAAEVKCTLQSSLHNLKSIADITVLTNTNRAGEYLLKIDKDVWIDSSHLSTQSARLVHLEADVQIIINVNNENYVTILSSSTIYNDNKVEAIIPPSSCFNLILKESITPVTIDFIATGITGKLTANILGTDSSDVSPCS